MCVSLFSAQSEAGVREPMPVVITNKVMPVDVRNTRLDVEVTNYSVPVDVRNTIDVKVWDHFITSGDPIPVRITR